MGKRRNIDKPYKRIVSGVLSGMIFPTEEIAAHVLMGTLQQSALTGLTAFSGLLQNFGQQTAPSQPMQDVA